MSEELISYLYKRLYKSINIILFMVTVQEAEGNFEEKYNNQRRGKSLNINKQLSIDYKIFCENLSRKTKKKVTPSSRIRILMVKDMLENKKI